jgi:hypothetical protein
MLFAHLKRILKLDRLRLRGPNGARDEFILIATAQNLSRMAKLIPMQTTRPYKKPIQPFSRIGAGANTSAYDRLFQRNRPFSDLGRRPLSRRCWRLSGHQGPAA